MTRNEQALPEQAILGCPFCGVVPRSTANSAVKGGFILIHPEGTPRNEKDRRCPLEGDYFAPCDWNRRPAVSDGAGEVLREALETARDYVSDVADGSAIYVFTAKAANEQMRETARKDLTRIDAALAAPGQDEGVGS